MHVCHPQEKQAPTLPSYSHCILPAAPPSPEDALDMSFGPARVGCKQSLNWVLGLGRYRLITVHGPGCRVFFLRFGPFD